MTNIFGEAGLSDMQTRKLVKLRIYTYELKKKILISRSMLSPVTSSSIELWGLILLWEPSPFLLYFGVCIADPICYGTELN